jgi:hypothetical protein
VAGVLEPNNSSPFYAGPTGRPIDEEANQAEDVEI